MRILLIGKNGQVGWELNRTLLPLGEVIATDYPEIDFANANQIRQLVRDVQPRVIVNASAYTDVDQAESEQDLAFAINGTAPKILAEEAKDIDAMLIHYSTDYVFDGKKDSGYIEEDAPQPINFYGESKLAGEQAVQAVDGDYLILRTSWVYSMRRPCFVTKVLKWAREYKTIRIVDDQIGNPTWSRALAEITAQVLAKGSTEKKMAWLRKRRGTYHLAGNGSATRYEWAQAILDNDPQKYAQIVEELLPAQSSEFPTPARRPAYSALDCKKFGRVFNVRLSYWKELIPLAVQQ